MYGLVNQAIKDLVVERFGNSKWEEICTKASCPPDNFKPLEPYPDALTYGLVGSASEILGVDASTLLTQFGEYWILYTASQGYGELLNLFGRDFKSCLKNLNHMHARMGATMPALQPPRFDVRELSETQIELHYISKRPGLAPMVKGLLYGLARRHGTEVSVSLKPRPEGADRETFLITILK